MAFGVVALNPGIDTQHTPAQLTHGWSAANLVRFRDGFPEKMGGWAHLNATALTGTALGMHAWADLNGTPYLMAGTEQRAQVYFSGSLYDVTPIRKTKNVTPNFSTQINSNVVTVTGTNHGASPGDWVYISTPISIGGLLLYGYYLVQTLLDINDYTIQAATTATSTVSNGGTLAQFTTTINSQTVTVALANHGLTTGQNFNIETVSQVGGLNLFGNVTVTVLSSSSFTFQWGVQATFNDTEYENGGNVQFEYLIDTGLAYNQLVGGYGSGLYSAGYYGEANTPAFPGHAKQWFWDNWGEFGLGNPVGDTLYVWMPLTGGLQRATAVTNAPAIINASFVAMPQRIAVALGSSVNGVFDPSLISWSDAEDYTDWTATVSNQAGTFRIPTGSKVVGGIQAPLQALVWTDIDLYVMQYQGLPFVWGFTKIADGCGLISARAPGVIGNMVVWPGPQGFFVFAGGSVQPLECPVWRTFYKNVNMAQLDLIACKVNVAFNEIEWHYPSGTNTQNDSYILYNVLDGTWSVGSLGRSAWVGQSPLGTPIGADYTGLLQQHEVGYSADGGNMSSYVISGLMDVSNGHDFIFMDQFLPDFVDSVPVAPTPSSPQISLTGYRTPNDPTPKGYGPYPTIGVQYISTRFRGRLAQMMISDTSQGFWRLGEVRYRFVPDGSR